jgi:hypothetical protein
MKINSKEAKTNKPYLRVTAWETPPPDLLSTQATAPEPTPASATLVVNQPDSAGLGETFKVGIEAQNVGGDGLYGVQFELNYNPAMLSVTNLQVNSDLPFIVLSDIDATAGKISLAASRQGRVPGLTGNITIATFDVTASGNAGLAALTFANQKFSDPNAQTINLAAQDSTILISEAAQPAPTNEPESQPTDEATPVTVLSQVILTGRTDNNWSGVVVTVGDNGQSVTTDASGNFRLENVAAGSHTSITADAPGYLSAVCVTPIVAPPQTNLLSVTLLSGDVNDDDAVDITDATAVGTRLGASGSELPEDLNKDNTVDIFDIVLVSLNFGQTGPQPWICQ